MEGDQNERLQAELSLLEAMYPREATYNEMAREVKYSRTEGSMQLRLPDGYLVDQLPEMLSATVQKVDMRESLKQAVRFYEPGDEVLESIIWDFTELVRCSTGPNDLGVTSSVTQTTMNGESESESKCTIVIWLHHLLNTNKRKQALSPPSPDISGVTKPGYCRKSRSSRSLNR